MHVSWKRALAVVPLAAVVLLALTGGGCSFKVVIPPPPPSEWPKSPAPGAVPEARCTASPVPPIADTAAALLFGGLAFLERDAVSRATPIVLGAASLPFAGSAIYGFIVITECQRYLRSYNP